MSSIHRIGAALVGASLAGPLAADGNPHECHQQILHVQPTSWQTTIEIPRFDPALGILTTVGFNLTAKVQGSAAIESLDQAPTQVDTNFEATVTLRRPDDSALLMSNPGILFQDPVTSFDGVVDFGGTSGVTHSGINQQKYTFSYSSTPADLALFSGPAGNAGTILLPVTGVASTTTAGAANLATQFTTGAGALIQICYYWEPDCNGNGIPDHFDVDRGSNDFDGDDVPDECQPLTRSFCEGSGTIAGGVECPCGNNGQPGEGCSSGNGTGGLLTATGMPSVSNDTLQITASQIFPIGSPGYFFTGTGPLNNGAGVPFGSGLRCIDNANRLLKVDGGGTLPLPDSPPLHLWLGASAGDHSFVQYWYRNPHGPCPDLWVNTTNALEIVWGL